MIRRIGPALLVSLAVIAAAAVALWLAFDDPLTLLRENALILPIAVVAAAFANATGVVALALTSAPAAFGCSTLATSFSDAPPGWFTVAAVTASGSELLTFVFTR